MDVSDRIQSTIADCERANAALVQDLRDLKPIRPSVPLVGPKVVEEPTLTPYEQMTRLAALMRGRSPAAYQRAVSEQLETLVSELKDLSRHGEDVAYEIGLRLCVLKENKPKDLTWGKYLKDQGLPWNRAYANQFIRIYKGQTTLLEIQEKRRQSMAKSRANRPQRGSRAHIETKRENGATSGGSIGSACDINWENHREHGGESDAKVRARAVEWQLHEAERLATEFALLRPGTGRSEIKPGLNRKIGKVIAAWRKLQTEMKRRTVS